MILARTLFASTPLAVLVLVFALAVSFLGPTIGKIEGRLWPVTSRVELLSAENAPPPDYRYRFAARADKFRECDFAGLEWYLGDQRGGSVPVRAFFADPPEIRGAGILEWSGLLISLAEDDVRGNSYALVYHDCGWPWLTVTLFFDSDG